jgi:VanZ family protein
MMRNCRLPWWPWLAVLGVWTALLVFPGYWFPHPPPAVSVGELGAGKLLHVAAYAALAASAGWLPASVGWRTLLVVLLVGHGGLTEWLQTFVPWREGCWRDVGIDAAGVTVGWLASRWWWPR